MSAAALAILAGISLLPACATHKVAPGQEVWAEVDGQPIYREQVERLYRGRTAQGTDAATPEEAASFKLNVLNELINNQILVMHASHSRITASEAEIDAKVGELKSPYSPEEFQKKLQEQGLDNEALRKQIRENLILTKLINKDIISHINVTDAEIASYYEKNKANFNVTETTYHIAQIQVTPRPDAEVRNLKNDDAKTPAAAEHKIQALYRRPRARRRFCHGGAGVFRGPQHGRRRRRHGVHPRLRPQRGAETGCELAQSRPDFSHHSFQYRLTTSLNSWAWRKPASTP